MCGSDGVLSGETILDPEYDEGGPCGFTLSMTGETFERDQCGLSFDDYEEIINAGIDPEVDRTDESDQWAVDYADYDEGW